MRWMAAALMFLLTAPVTAQVTNRPTDPPIVTAENDLWYRRGEPLVYSGEFYYPAGAVVFFNGDTMVRTGHYNGVPVYADTTLEPHSILFVPIGRGQMQPYERRRTGDLAGTSGSRPPSFPGQAPGMPAALPIESISTFTTEPGAVATSGRGSPAVALAEAGEAPSMATEGTAIPRRQRSGRPFSYDSVSVRFMGEKWVMAGPSGPRRVGLVEIARYKGFPVYAEKGKERSQIYLPIAPGRLAPFKRQD